MTDKQLRIYEEMSDKTLSIGCVIRSNFGTYHTLVNNNQFLDRAPYEEVLICLNGQEDSIGHPVMIGSVIDYLEKQNWDLLHTQMLEDLFDKWKDKTKSIGEQSEECIDFVYSLLFNI